ncbi:MAG: hypothetical protein OXG37_12335 [Actinomycetia bacterium]|nr:hypothetical protein [Actinomycetes bacterium]
MDYEPDAAGHSRRGSVEGHKVDRVRSVRTRIDLKPIDLRRPRSVVAASIDKNEVREVDDLAVGVLAGWLWATRDPGPVPSVRIPHTEVKHAHIELTCAGPKLLGDCRKHDRAELGRVLRTHRVAQRRGRRWAGIRRRRRGCRARRQRWAWRRRRGRSLHRLSP